MPRVSRIPISNELRDEILHNLFLSFANLQTVKEIEKLLINLLTPTEKIMLSKRLASAVLLERGYTYDEICRVLKLSPGTVNSVNRELKKFGEGYKLAAELIMKNEKRNSKLSLILKSIDRAVGVLSLPMKGSSGSMRRWKNR